jgi:hypothetical protein
VRSAGYDVAFTVPRRVGPIRPYRWPRVSVFGSDPQFAFAIKTSRAARLARRTWVGATAAGLIARARPRSR